MVNYWSKREELSKKAFEHTDYMTQKYYDEILDSIRSTRVYGYPDEKPHGPYRLKGIEKVKVVSMDSVSAIYQYADGKTAVLNFASYKNPGGMFIKGSSAQEESLCHESFLYNVLTAFDRNYYTWNRAHLNRSLYENRALYTPGIVFERNGLEPLKCDVITCAAPNYTSALKYCTVSSEENIGVFTRRIRFIRDIAEDNDVETIILGAYGCGVFGQDPFVAANIFKNVFDDANIRRIIYAIPADSNLEAFKTVFKIN